MLTKFYDVKAADAPLYLIAFAVGNLAGPLTIGHLFDPIGRRKMISGTYILSGILLAITAYLFDQGVLNAITQTIAWSIIFFFASAGASAAYLTVSEVFRLEVRAQAIAVFFAIAQCFGAIGPVFYGRLIGEGSDPGKLFIGYTKPVSEWATGDEPATGPQLSYLSTLAREVGKDVPADLTKADASVLLDELQGASPRVAE